MICSPRGLLLLTSRERRLIVKVCGVGGDRHAGDTTAADIQGAGVGELRIGVVVGFGVVGLREGMLGSTY